MQKFVFKEVIKMKEDTRNLALQKLKTLKSKREELLSLQKELNDLKENDLVKRCK